MSFRSLISAQQNVGSASKGAAEVELSGGQLRILPALLNACAGRWTVLETRTNMAKKEEVVFEV